VRDDLLIRFLLSGCTRLPGAGLKSKPIGLLRPTPPAARYRPQLCTNICILVRVICKSLGPSSLLPVVLCRFHALLPKQRRSGLSQEAVSRY
jgi:hypothetical protein